MDLGLNIAAAGMLAQQVQVDGLSGDLANLSTPGYKPQSSYQESFGAMLLRNTSDGAAIGTVDSGVEVVKGQTILAQASLETTNRPLDFAIQGSGFFAVQTPSGVEFTRNGRFSLNAAGELTDASGDPVLSANRTPVRAGAGGAVPASAVGVFAVSAPAHLGNNNFSGRIAGNATGTVLSGHLEASGVNPVNTITQMEGDESAYQAGQQVLATLSQSMTLSASTVGLVTGG